MKCSIIKVGLKSSTVDTNAIEVDYLGKTQQALLIVPWGLFTNLPDDDILTMLIPQDGNEGSLMAVATDIANRDDDLDENEIAIGVPTEEARLRFTNDGKIKFKIGDTLGGDYSVRYNELDTKLQDLIDQFNDFRGNIYANHTHIFNYNAGPTPASGTTNTGLPAGSDITVDFTDAKIEEIEVPEL